AVRRTDRPFGSCAPTHPAARLELEPVHDDSLLQDRPLECEECRAQSADAARGWRGYRIDNGETHEAPGGIILWPPWRARRGAGGDHRLPVLRDSQGDRGAPGLTAPARGRSRRNLKDPIRNL